MLSVKIFKLEDHEEPVSTLIKGSYVLGRGPMLKCFDKRVSRNHAKLLIGDQNVTLTSTHINPCFHRALAGKGITIIPKDQTKVLQNGDKFALLADQFWYEIKVQVKGDNEDKSPQLTQNQACEPSNNHTVMMGNETINVANSNSPSDPSRNKSDKKEEEIIDVQDSEKPVDTKAQEEQDMEDIAEPTKVTSENKDVIDPSQSLLCSNVITGLPVNSPTISISSEENRANQKRNPSDDVSSSPQKRQKMSPKRDDKSNTADENMEVTVNKDDDNVKENANMGDSVDDDSQLNLCLVGSSEEDKNKEAQMEEQVQEEIDKEDRQAEDEDRMETSTSKPAESEGGNRSRDEFSECAQNEDADKRDSSSPTRDSSKEHGGNKDDKQSEPSLEYAQNENVVEEARSVAEEPVPNNDDGIGNEPGDGGNQAAVNVSGASAPGGAGDPGASSSMGPATATTRRDRCWYGQTCYRKDPTHKTHFSHPGDDDYDSDPKDDRPTCAYGAACYRRNLNHRQRYKHPGPPAPNPNNNTNAMNGLPRRRATARVVNYNDNNTPDDDYDYSDPFIDDGSSDEYHASDNSDSDTDTEFTPSQDSEDLKALIKDAKKFTKR